MSSAAEIRERMVARSKKASVPVPHVFGVTLPMPAKALEVALVVKVVAEFVVIIFPERQSFRRGLDRFRLRGRCYSGGHKRRNAHRFLFPQGSGGHDPEYKDVRRGRARV